MKFSKEDLEAVSGRLRELPGKEDARKHTKRAAIAMLSGEITELKRRGYTLEQIAEALSGSGLPISTPTLKNYLHRQRRTAERSKGSRTGSARRAPGKHPVSPAAAFRPTPDSDDI
jgi:hypothetical protein